MSNTEKIALLTDSCVDIPPAMMKGKAVYVVPLKIICQDGEYADGVTIQAQDVYRRLQQGELPHTSLPDGGTVSAILDQIRADGYQKVIAVMLSGGLSGTYNMVRIMAQEREDLEIVVFDSGMGSLGMGMVVLQVWEEILAGAQWQDLIAQRVQFLIDNTYVIFSLNTLEYLRRGGRIGGVSAMAGSLLSIKPILGFAEDGQLTSVAKVRGRKQVQGKLVSLLEEQFTQEERPYNVGVAHGGALEEMMELREQVVQTFPHHHNLWHGTLDGTLSVYIGDGILGAAVQFLA